MSKSWKCTALVVVLCVAMLAASCYGPFNATRCLYKWNGDVSSNKWAVEGVFLVCSILPVYGLFMLGDALIFNSIEFWGGSNPIDPPSMVMAGQKQLDQVAATYGLPAELVFSTR